MHDNVKRALGVILYPISAGLIAALNILDQTALPASFDAWLSSLKLFGLDLSAIPWSALSSNEVFFTVHSFCLGLIIICLLFGDLDWFHLVIIVVANAVPDILFFTDMITKAALERLLPFASALSSSPELSFLFIVIPIPLSLAMAFGGFNIFTLLVWWHRRSAMRRRRIRKYPEMNWDVKALEGINEVESRILHRYGVKTIDDLLHANVKKLAKQTGIDSKDLWHWRDAAELVSVEGIDPVQAEILAGTGINCIYELSVRSPKLVMRRYNRIARKLGFPEIDKETAKKWRENAKLIRKGKWNKGS